jgi:lipopolysaccharide export system protein LptA
MRVLLLFLGIAGSAVLASGQTGPAQGQISSITAPWQQMSANSMTRTGPTTWQLRGSVRIVQEAAIITADEVDARTARDGTMEYDLRGNVHLTLNSHK